MEIKISKSGRQCRGCEKTFTHEQRIVSALARGEQGWTREDYCPGCLNDERGEAALCVWTAEFQDPHVLEQQPAEVLSPLRQVFYETVEREGRSAVAVAYLAGQLLRRQKAFRFIKQTVDPESEAAVLLFLDRIGSKLIEVHDPNLTTGELERGRVELLHRLAELEGSLDESETNESAAAPVEVMDGSPRTQHADEQGGEAVREDELAEDEFDDDDDEYDDDDDEEYDDDEEEDEEMNSDGETEDKYAQT